MNRLIKDAKFLIEDIDEKPLSLITKVLGYVSLNYIFDFEDHLNRPLIIGLPSKENLSLHIATVLLKQLFKDDYVEKSELIFSDLGLEEDMRIKIFGQPTSWNSRNEQFGKIKLSPGPNAAHVSYKVKAEWLPYIEKIKGGSRISKVKTFFENLKEKRNTNSSLDKYLDYNEVNGIGVSHHFLRSQVILVSGRRKKGKVESRLRSINIYDETFYDLLVRHDYIDIKADLSEYVNFFDGSVDQIGDWENTMRIIIDIVDPDNSEFWLDNILDQLSEDFNENIEEFQNSVYETRDNITIETFERLIARIPNRGDRDFGNVKCIIIEDSSLVSEYPTTIKGFLSEGIPVIVIHDFGDQALNIDAIENYYRFFLSKEKLELLLNYETLENIDEELDTLDSNFVRKCSTIVSQSFTIELFDDNKFSSMLSKLSKEIFNLEGKEDFKKIFWSELYPLLYKTKNSPGINLNTVISDNLKFYSEFLNVRDSLSSSLQEFIQSLFNLDWVNSKVLADEIGGFNQEIKFKNSETISYEFNNGIESIFSLEDKNSVQFSGYPFKERYQNNLSNAVYKKHIPNIHFSVFSKELERIKIDLQNYIRPRFFSDCVPFIDQLNEDYLFTKEKVESEIKKILSSVEISENNESNDDFHDSYITNIQQSYTSYDENENIVDAITLNFTNSEWMFVKKDFGLTTINEAPNHFELEVQKPNKLSKGDIVLFYSLDVTQLTILANNNNALNHHLQKLQQWRNVVIDRLNKINVQQISEELFEVKNEFLSKHKILEKSNPSIPNIRNWSQDLNLICPLASNLFLLLLYGDIISEYENILESNSAIRSFRSRIRRQIKAGLENNLENLLIDQNNNISYNMPINGVELEVDIRQIASIDFTSKKIPYPITRKILSI